MSRHTLGGSVVYATARSRQLTFSEIPCALALRIYRDERVARESYGRLVAYLSASTHDVAAAEDALGEALLKALTRQDV